MTQDHLHYVTVLFCDLAGSTELATDTAPEVLAGVLDGYFQQAQTAVEDHGGRVEKFIGDAVCAVFRADEHGGNPARAALGAIEQLLAWFAHGADPRWGLGLRTGLASGYVALGSRDSTFAIGQTLNLAARLQGVSPANGVAMDLSSWLHVCHLVPGAQQISLPLKGFGDVTAWTAEDLSRPGPGVTGTPLVDRHVESARLTRFVEEAIRAGAGSLTRIWLVGEAGVGKSRLASELTARREASGARTLLVRCERGPAREGLLASYLVLDAVAAADPASVTVTVATRPALEATLTERAAGHNQGDVWALVGRELARWANGDGLVVVVDDADAIPSALAPLEPTLESLASVGSAIVLLSVGRGDRADQEAIRLVVTPLGHEDALELASVAGGDIELHLHDADLAGSGGNPLFIEQLVAHRRFAGSTGPPPAIDAIMSERIGLLGEDAGEVLLLLAAGGGRLNSDDLPQILAGTDVATGLAELMSQGMLDEFALSCGELTPRPALLAEVALRRSTRRAVARVQRLLGRHWQAQAEARPTCIELAAEHWLDHLEALRAAGLDPASSAEGDRGLIIEALATAAKLSLARGEPDVAARWLARAQNAGVCEGASFAVLEMLVAGYRGRFAEAAERLAALGPALDAESASLALWARSNLGGSLEPGEVERVCDEARDSANSEALAIGLLTWGLQALNAGDFDRARELLEEAWVVVADTPHRLGELEIRNNLGLALVYSSAHVVDVAALAERLAADAEGSVTAAVSQSVLSALVDHLRGDTANAHRTLDLAVREVNARGLLRAGAELVGFQAWMFAREGEWRQAVHQWTRQAGLLVGGEDHDGAEVVMTMLTLADWDGVERLSPPTWLPRSATTRRLFDLASGVAEPDPALQAESCARVLDDICAQDSLGAALEVVLLLGRIADRLGMAGLSERCRGRLDEVRAIRGDAGLTGAR